MAKKTTTSRALEEGAVAVGAIVAILEVVRVDTKEVEARVLAFRAIKGLRITKL